MAEGRVLVLTHNCGICLLGALLGRKCPGLGTRVTLTSPLPSLDRALSLVGIWFLFNSGRGPLTGYNGLQVPAERCP